MMSRLSQLFFKSAQPVIKHMPGAIQARQLNQGVILAFCITLTPSVAGLLLLKYCHPIDDQNKLENTTSKEDNTHVTYQKRHI